MFIIKFLICFALGCIITLHLNLIMYIVFCLIFGLWLLFYYLYNNIIKLMKLVKEKTIKTYFG